MMPTGPTAVVVVVPRRGYGYGSFTAFTDATVEFSPADGRGRVEFTFSEDLDTETAQAVWAWLDSRDDVDQAKRAVLRADRDALPADDPLRRLYDAVLGD